MSNMNCSGEDWLRSPQKRSVDLAIAGLLLPLALPVAAIGASTFYAETGINPLFYQERERAYDVPVHILKLRTMPFRHDLSDGSQGSTDPRASRIGRILRKTKIDESPQLLHILAGQMSVVGPRPIVRSDVEQTLELLSPQDQASWQRSRQMAKPGWMSAFTHYSRDLQPQTDEFLLARVESDCKYAKDASYQTDVSIMQHALGMKSTEIAHE